MIATITLNHVNQRSDFVESIKNSNDVGSSSVLHCDFLCLLLANYFGTRDRTYKADGNIVLDTVSFHSKGSVLGIRFYWKTKIARNKRGAFYAEFEIDVEDALYDFKKLTLEKYCDQLADSAIEKINNYVKKD
jgi:hypothetical protein